MAGAQPSSRHFLRLKSWVLATAKLTHQAAKHLLHDEGGDGNHWVTLELAATKGNRLAIGARIRAVTGSVVQTEEIRSGGSYLSQNDLRVHFGLGKYAKIDLLEIRWPDGRVEQLKDVGVDKFYSILEGAGLVPFERIRPPAKATK